MDATTAATIAEKRAAVLNACRRLAELDAVPVNEQAVATYTVGDQSLGWNEYRASLRDEIEGLEKSIETTLKIDTLVNGPYTLFEVVR